MIVYLSWRAQVAPYWPGQFHSCRCQRQPCLEMVNLDEDPDEIIRRIRESVAQHGEQGVVDMRALQMQDIAALVSKRPRRL